MKVSALIRRRQLKNQKKPVSPRVISILSARPFPTRYILRRIGLLSFVLTIGLYLIWKAHFRPVVAYPGSRYAFADQLLNAPDSEIDIGIIALTLEKDFHPDLDIAAYSAKIDELVVKVLEKTGGALDPETRIRALNTVIYRDEGYGYDMSRIGKNAEDATLFGLLDSKKGNCLTLTTLYMTVAKRLGYPIYAVTAPSHVFLRYVGADLTLYNIEPTNGGGYSWDQDYVEHCHPSLESVNSGAYLRTLDDTEFIGFLFARNADIYSRAGQNGEAVDCLEAAYRISPLFTPVMANLGLVYEKYSEQLEGKEAAYYREAGERLLQRVVAMGDGGIIGELRPGFEKP